MPYIGKSPTGSGVRTRYYFTATGGETSLSGADDGGKTLTFSDGEYVDVYLNGVALVAGTDYGTATANTIGGLAALSGGDIVEVVVYDIYNVAKINSEAVRTRHYYTAAGGETSVGTAQIPGLSFPGGTEIEVSLNGISLVQGTDYNTTSANTVGGLSALSAGNVVAIVLYEKFQLADTVSKAQGGTFGGGVTITGNLTVTGTSPGKLTGIQTFTSSGTYTPTAGTTKVLVYAVGGGGAGGGVNGQGTGTGTAAVGGGGGGGGCAIAFVTSLGATETVTVGAGGTGVNSTTGGAGGTTSFGSHAVASGGSGGIGSTASAPSYTRMTFGGAAGGGSTGDVQFTGTAGGYGVAGGTSASEVASGGGGSSFFGGGERGQQADNNGRVGRNYGGGGSGAAVNNISTNYAGGDGKAGIVVIYEYQ